MAMDTWVGTNAADWDEAGRYRIANSILLRI